MIRQYIIRRHDYEGYDATTKTWGSWRDATVFPGVIEAIKAAPRETGTRVQDFNHNVRLTWWCCPNGDWISHDGNFLDPDAPNLIALSPKYLCSLVRENSGERIVQYDLSDLSAEFKKVGTGFAIKGCALCSTELMFNKDGLQIDSNGNVLGNPSYWLEFDYGDAAR